MSAQPPLRMNPRRRDAHKGNFGRAVLVGGSRGMVGSIAMSAMSALRVGAGLVTAAVPDRCLETVAAYHPCLMTLPLADDGEGRFSVEAAAEIQALVRGASAIACGPGMTVQPGTLRLVERLVARTDVPRVFDADAINALALLDWPRDECFNGPESGPLVLTPHPGELKRLTGVSSGDREGQVAAAEALAERRGVVIVVKGGPTVVVAPGCQAWTNETGNPGMATAGSGDVLTGVVTGLLAQGLTPWDAARLGVWVHGLAGDLASIRLGQLGMTALDILDSLPEAISMAISA